MMRKLAIIGKAAPFIAALMSISLLAPARSFAGEEGETLRRIEADWASRRKAMRRVKYVADGEALFAKGCFNDLPPEELNAAEGADVPKEDQTFPLHLTLMLDLEHALARKEWTEYAFTPHNAKVTPSDLVNVFDGSVMRQRHVRRGAREGAEEAHIDLLIPRPASFKRAFFDYNDYALLCAHGIVPGVANLPIECLQTASGIGNYAPHGEAVHKERRLLVLRTPAVEGAVGTFAEIWVDLDRQSAVARWATYSDGAARLRLDVTYADGPNGWLPRTWEFARFRFGGAAPETLDTCRVTAIEADPDFQRELFREDPERGMIVHDDTTGATYRYEGAGRPPRQIMEPDRPPPDLRGRVSPFLIASVLLLVAVAVYLLNRLWRSASAGRR